MVVKIRRNSLKLGKYPFGAFSDSFGCLYSRILLKYYHPIENFINLSNQIVEVKKILEIENLLGELPVLTLFLLDKEEATRSNL